MTRMTRPADDGDGSARPSGVTLLDKVAFFSWAADAHRLDGGELNILRVVVFDLLGLDGGKPHNAWTTLGVLVTSCGLHRRTVQRALDRLDELGLVKHFGVAGRGGRTLLHVPGVVDAAKLLKRRSLHDGTKDEPAPNGLDETVDNSGESADTSSKRRRGRHLNPLKESSCGLGPSEWVSGTAVNGPQGEPSASDLEEQEGTFGGEAESVTLTRPRQRLWKRLAGVAEKVGLQDGGAELQRSATEETVRRWLRLQRERKNARLVQEMSQALVDEYALDPEEVGSLLASKPDPEPEPPPPKPEPETAANPNRPPASPWSPPTPNVRFAPRAMARAIREPELSTAPPPMFTCDPALMRESAVRLGFQPRGLAS